MAIWKGKMSSRDGRRERTVSKEGQNSKAEGIGSLGQLQNECAQGKLLVKVRAKQFRMAKKPPERLVKQQAHGRLLQPQPAQKLIGSDRQTEKIRNEVKERKT